MDLEQVIKNSKETYKKPEKISEEREVIERYGKIFNPHNLDSFFY